MSAVTQDCQHWFCFSTVSVAPHTSSAPTSWYQYWLCTATPWCHRWLSGVWNDSLLFTLSPWCQHWFCGVKTNSVVPTLNFWVALILFVNTDSVVLAVPTPCWWHRLWDLSTDSLGPTVTPCGVSRLCSVNIDSVCQQQPCCAGTDSVELEPTLWCQGQHNSNIVAVVVLADCAVPTLTLCVNCNPAVLELTLLG